MTPAWPEVPLLVVFVVAAWRNKWISDDGYIYLTYVEHAVNGNGATFNVGEHVEAYTSVGWFALLTLARFVVRFMSLETLTLLIGLAMSTLAVWLWVPIERRAATVRTGRSSGRAVVNVPLALAAGSYVFASFATSGLETPLLMLWCSGVVLAVWTVRPDWRLLAALAGGAPLVRPDLAVLGVALAVLAWRLAPAARRWWAVVAVALPLTISVIVRVGLYGQLVPNTYYAKTGTGHGWSDGARYFRDAAMPYALQWLIVACVALAVAGPLRRWVEGRPARDLFDRVSTRSLLLLAGVVVTGVQVLTVGGDFMHGRFWIVPWWLALGSLAGIGSAWSPAGHGDRRAIGAALAVALALCIVQLWSTSIQRLYAADRFFEVGDIADEQAYYETTNPDLHALRPHNESSLFRLGRTLGDWSQRVGEELGVSVGAVGQVSYGAATSGGDVYVYDLIGLTRLDVSRLTVAGDTRVGHARTAPDVMVATDPRVDFHPLAFPGYAEAFAIDADGFPLVLVNLDLIDDLLRAGVIDDAVVARMQSYLGAALADPAVDPDLVTFVTERAHDDQQLVAAATARAGAERGSSWRAWLDATAAQRALLSADGCGNRSWFSCARLAIDRHRADPIELP